MTEAVNPFNIDRFLEGPVQSHPMVKPEPSAAGNATPVAQQPSAAAVKVPTEVGGGFDVPVKSFPMTSQTPTPVWTDIGKTLAPLPARVAYSLPGIPGSVGEFINTDIPTMARGTAGWIGQKAGITSPATAQRLAEPTSFTKMLGVPNFPTGPGHPYKDYLPTVAEREAEFNKTYGSKPGMEWLAYQPQTTAGKVVQAMGEGAWQGAPGVFKGMAGRIATGALGAGAGKGAEIWDPDDPIVPVIAGVVGSGVGSGAAALTHGAIGQTAKGLASPSLGLKSELNSAILSDLKNDPEKLAQLREAIAQGQDIKMFDLAQGPNASNLIEKYAHASPANVSRVNLMNEALLQRNAGAKSRTADWLSKTFSDSDNLLNPASEDARIKAATDAEVRAGYGVTGPSGPPTADVIHSDEFGDAWKNSDLVKRAMEKAAASVPNDINNARNVRPPSYHTIPDPAGGPDLHVEVPGNLAFYDQVKRELDHFGEYGKPDSKIDYGSNTIADARAAKRHLVDVLDTIVPEYETARDTASEAFKARNAPEAGLNFFKARDTYARDDYMKAFNKYTPEQKSLFNIGQARAILERVESGGINSAYDHLLKSTTRDALTDTMGEAGYRTILGKLAQEKMMQYSTASEPSLKSGIRADVGRAGTLGVLGGGAAAVLSNVVGGFPFVGESAGPLVAAGLFGGGATILSGLSSVAERKVGERLIKLVTDVNNPNAAKQLGDLLDKQPSVLKIFNKMTVTAQQAANQAAQQYVTRPMEQRADRPAPPAPQTSAEEMRARTMRMVREFNSGQATGGRVGYRAGGRILDHASKADALVRAAETARKQINGTTEPLLGMPDESVVKALAVANENI